MRCFTLTILAISLLGCQQQPASVTAPPMLGRVPSEPVTSVVAATFSAETDRRLLLVSYRISNPKRGVYVSGRLALFEVGSGKRLWACDVEEVLQPLTFLDGGAKFLVDSRKGLDTWDTTSGKMLHRLPTSQVDGSLDNSDKEREIGAVPSPDGRHVLIGRSSERTKRYSIEIWDAIDGKRVQRFETKDVLFCPVAWSPDGKRALSLVGGGQNGGLRLWDISTGNVLRTLLASEGWDRPVRFAPDSQSFVACKGVNLIVCHVETGEQVGRLSYEAPAGPNVVAFTPDGRHLLVGNNSNSIQIWDLTKQVIAKTIPVPFEFKREVGHCVFSADGKVVFTEKGQYPDAMLGGWLTLTIWDIASGKPICNLIDPPLTPQ